MDPELPIIFTFVFTMAVMVLTMAHIFHRRTVLHEERKLELKARIAEAKAGDTNVDSAAHAKLEERVRVLERIATDSNHALASQIEQLRDLNEIDEQTTRREIAQ